jgi:hypothetical protein
MTPEELRMLRLRDEEQRQRANMAAQQGLMARLAQGAVMADGTPTAMTPTPQQDINLQLQRRMAPASLQREQNFMRGMQEVQAATEAQEPRNVPQKSLLGSIGSFFGDRARDPAYMARLSAGLQSMTLNPNQQFIQSQMQRAGDIQTARQEAQQANVTAQYFRQQGQPQIADLIESVPGIGAEALKTLFREPAKTPSILQEYLFAKSQMPELTYEQFLQMKKQAGTSITVGGDSVTPGFEALDKAYAQDHLEWVRGGRADMESQVQNIGEVMGALEQGQPLTGTLMTLAPDFIRAFTDPESLDAQQKVEEVVQRSLRVTLGAQFTEKEGERLIARAYNPQLSPEINARRLRKLYQKLGETAQARNAMADYFDTNGTLQGYRGPEVSIADLFTAVSDYAIGEIITDPSTGEKYEYLGGDAADEKNYRKIN